MSLNWSLADAPRKDEALSKENWDWTEVVIFECMAVEVGEITEKNVADFITRSELRRRLDKLEPISREAIYRCIGLSTNVLTVPWGKWAQRLIGHVYKDHLRMVTNFVEVELGLGDVAR